MHPLIEARLKDVDENLHDPSQPESVIQSVREHLQAHQDALRTVASPGAKRAFYREYVDRAYRRAAAESKSDLPDDETPRSDPLCECDDPFCAVKDGRLPADVRLADDPDTGIAEFRRHHPRPVALIEAQRAKRDAETRVLTVLQTCQIALYREQPVDEVVDGASADGEAAD